MGPNPYKKRKSHQGCPGTEKRPGEDRARGCRLHAKEMAIGGTQTCRHLDLGFPASGAVRNECLCTLLWQPWLPNMGPLLLAQLSSQTQSHRRGLGIQCNIGRKIQVQEGQGGGL